ncbi:MAG TPA: hypothetical protein VE397_00140, partial [Stellaceae bacterium]|nr:hypothetical protein [Stellaceae bacterium]
MTEAMDQNTGDRRLVMRVLSLWREMAVEGRLPRRSQIDPRRFGPDWSNCLLIDVDPEPESSRLAFVGDRLRDPTWPTFDRQCIGECAEKTLLRSATAYLARVVAEREPLAEGVALHVGAPVRYRSIL